MTTSVQLSSIVAIALRLFALYFAGMFLLLLVSVLATGQGFQIFSYPQARMMLVTPAAYLILMVVLWIFARPLSLRITAATTNDELLVPTGAAAHLYTLGFLITGLYFFISHFPGCLNWLYYFAITKSAETELAGSGSSVLNRFSSDALPVVLGAFIIALAPKWGKRMAATFDRTPEPPAKL